MKYLFLLFSFLAISCCVKKNAIEAQPETEKEVAVVAKGASSFKILDSDSNDGEIKELVEVVDHEGNTIAEFSSQEETNKLIIKKPTFNQNTSSESFSHYAWGDLLQKNVSKSGKVNYAGFKIDIKQLRSYIDSLTTLPPAIDWPKEEKIAYWINAYNALTIDLILKNYPLKSIKDIKDPWDQRLWKFGNKWLNLNDIEHNILRKMKEPRIHFAIVCASKSCPKLQNTAFTAENLDELLTKATKEFLSDTTKNEISENELKLSKIFKWFKKDFEQDGSLIDFLNRYSDITISEKAKKSYKNYSWDLND